MDGGERQTEWYKLMAWDATKGEGLLSVHLSPLPAGIGEHFRLGWEKSAPATMKAAMSFPPGQNVHPNYEPK